MQYFFAFEKLELTPDFCIFAQEMFAANWSSIDQLNQRISFLNVPIHSPRLPSAVN